MGVLEFRPLAVCTKKFQQTTQRQSGCSGPKLCLFGHQRSLGLAVLQLWQGEEEGQQQDSSKSLQAGNKVTKLCENHTGD